MENIRQAVERARARQGVGPEQPSRPSPDYSRRHAEIGAGAAYGNDGGGDFEEIELNSAFLQSKRIISHLVSDPRARSFDMLRTQVLQSMDMKGWKLLAITSPSPACGKTLMALNLALSIARQPERSVLLVDLDFQRPRVAASLGLECDGGVLDVLAGHASLSSAIVHARVGKQRFMVLPTASAVASSELMASRALATMFQDLKRDYPAQTIILDLPPILSGDEVISVLPQIDCVLVVAAVGTSTVAEIEECNKHLQSVDVVRVVLNKVTEASPNYYY